jgi:NitT/TauT family transport system substrate-binding protein
VAAGGDVNDPGYLRGKKVDIVPSTWMHYYMEKEFATIGLQIDEIQEMSVPIVAQLDALAQGGLDITSNNEPWITRMKQAGHQQILTPVSDLLPNAQFSLLVAGPGLIGENIEIGKRFMVAYLQAVRQYNQGKTDRNIEIIAQYTQEDPEVLSGLCWPTVRSNGEINEQSILDFQNWAIEKGHLEHIVGVETYFESQLIDHAAAELGMDGE